MEELKACPMRHENGNCLTVGGFCTSVPKAVCEAVKQAYQSGLYDGKEKANRHAEFENKPLTITFPCQIGDTIYEIEEGLPIISYRVTGFVLGKTEFEDDYDVEERHGWQVEYGKSGIDCECPVSEFGKSLFLTREAAEQALNTRKPEGSKSS